MQLSECKHGVLDCFCGLIPDGGTLFLITFYLSRTGFGSVRPIDKTEYMVETMKEELEKLKAMEEEFIEVRGTF